MSEWQPIETAPKDGTIVLLYDGAYPIAGFFDFGGWIPADVDLQDMWPQIEVTHWMPLPEPPK